MTIWFNKQTLDQKCKNEDIYPWLVDAYNLTDTLKNTEINFSLKLLSQQFETPYTEETDAFNLPNSANFLVRKVVHEANNIPFIFARVIVPQSTYENYKIDFDNLGNNPIGNTLLYYNSQIIRKPFEYALISNDNEVFKEIRGNQDFYWARRSIFILPKGSLLINEFFIRDLPDWH